MARDGTYFKTDRKIFEGNLWKNILEFRLFFYLIGQARFSEEPIYKGGVKIERGQYLRSYRKLQEDLEYIENNGLREYSLSQLKKAIGNLVKEERIKIKSTKLGTLFTVLNYAEYQGKYEYKNGSLEQTSNRLRTDLEQTSNNTNNGVRMVKNGVIMKDIVLREEIEKIYNELDSYWENIFREYINIYIQKNKSKKITDNRHYNLLKEVNDVFQKQEFIFDGKTYPISDKDFEYGLNQVIEKQIDNINYAKKVWINTKERRKSNVKFSRSDQTKKEKNNQQEDYDPFNRG